VRTGDTYGIVCYAQTSSLEPGRKPIARGKDETTEEAVYKSSPQLLKLLRSEFTAVVVGHQDGERLRHYLPPSPARIHSFVYLCQADEVKAFSQSFGFLNILLDAGQEVSADEIIAATLRRMSLAYDDSHAFLITAGKELATRLSQDFARLKSILGRLK
jgi:hypothetical protein